MDQWRDVICMAGFSKQSNRWNFSTAREDFESFLEQTVQLGPTAHETGLDSAQLRQNKKVSQKQNLIISDH